MNRIRDRRSVDLRKRVKRLMDVLGRASLMKEKERRE
jgi:hypothetical protein